MRRVLQAILVVAATTTLGSKHNYCYDDMMDQEAPLRKASDLLESFLNKSYDETIPQLQSLVKSFPKAEKCLANYDGSQLQQIIDSALVGKCMLLMGDLKKDEIGQFKTALGSITTDTKPFLEIQDSSYQAVCSIVTDHALPCVFKLIPDLVASLKAHSGSCCVDFFHQMDQNIGALEKAVPELVTLLAQALCSSKESEVCASSFVHVFLQPSGILDSVKQVLGGMQVANADGCAAAEGDPFVLTGTYDTTMTLGDKESNQIMSGCVAHLDVLAYRIRKLPFAKKNAAMEELFGDKSCLEFYKMDPTLKKLLPTTLYGMLASLMQKKCYHIATGFSDQCKFTQVTTLPTVPTNDDEDGGLTADTKDEPKNSVNARMVSTFTTMAAVGMALAL